MNSRVEHILDTRNEISLSKYKIDSKRCKGDESVVTSWIFLFIHRVSVEDILDFSR